jgi:hypothetical protein
MRRLTHHARGTAAIALIAAGSALLGACDPKQELLSPQQPGVITPGAVTNPIAADAEYLGAIGRLNFAMNGGGGNLEGLWQEEALFSDEVKSTDTFSQRNDADQRNLQTFDADLTGIYRKVQQVRGHARTAITGLLAFDPSQTGVLHVAEMYMVMGYAEMQLSGVFCNGIPFGETIDGSPTYTPPISDADGSKLAIARFDSALAYIAAIPATPAFTTAFTAAVAQVKNAALVAKARAQVDVADFAGAAATVAAVPTAFQYTLGYSQSSGFDNEWWVMGPNVLRYSAGDSVDITGQVFNAIPFAHLNDPRVPVTDQHKPAEDLQSNFVQINIWNRDDPVALLTGTDARLIEAEAKLQAGDVAGMMSILNALRADPQTFGIFKPAAMAPLAAPGDADAATNLFFREKALWQFGRGFRMDDLRRLVRQYQRTQDNVFPSGNFVRGGQYGAQTNFPVPDDEKTNTLFTGCLDTKA